MKKLYHKINKCQQKHFDKNRQNLHFSPFFILIFAFEYFFIFVTYYSQRDVIVLSSYWLNSIKEQPKFNKIDKNYQCDICIIGGGLTGLSCGYYLSCNGFKVIIVEKEIIGQKASGNTTGKITYQHNLIYDYLIRSYGEKFAKAYLTAKKMLYPI